MSPTLRTREHQGQAARLSNVSPIVSGGAGGLAAVVSTEGPQEPRAREFSDVTQVM